MTETVERVARVLKRKIGEAFAAKPLPGSNPEWGDWSATGGVLDLEELARAVIAAMREPTEAMLSSGEDSLEYTQVCRSLRDMGAEAWRAMIAAALAEPKL
jgi:hypothetical protein